MSVTEKSLSELDEADLQQLGAIKAPEGLMLEFKRELDLSSDAQKKEAAKDASALANTAGGRILYGMAEIKLPDGSTVAGALTPLSDGAAADRLSNVLNTTVHPRLRFDRRNVPVTGGLILALEVYPSSQLDLHMVTGYGDNRFYRRGPSGTVPMTEPEIRESYYRIAESRASVDARARALAEPELKLREQVDESILVLPFFSRPALIDPRQVGALTARLTTVLKDTDLWEVIPRLTLGYDGYRLVMGGTALTAGLYLSVLKSGVVHLSLNTAFDDKKTEFWYWSRRSALRILQTLLIAHEVLSLGNYWGPVRVMYQLRPTKPWRLDPDSVDSRVQALIPPGTYDGEASDVSLQRTKGEWDGIVRQLLDPMFHAAGRPESPISDMAGLQVPSGMRKDFAPLGTVARITFGR